MRLLLDTNVLIDYYLSRPVYCDDARQLFALAVRGKAELWASAKSFTDIFYVGRKAVGSEAMQRAIEASLAHLDVCSITMDDIQASLAERWPDFEDCLVARAAAKVKADYLVTRDANGFTRSTVPAISPAQAVQMAEGV